ARVASPLRLDFELEEPQPFSIRVQVRDTQYATRLHRRPSAIDRQHPSGYIRRLIRRQKERRIRDIFRVAHPAQKGFADLPLMQFRTQWRGDPGSNGSWTHRIAPDIV